jgi:hypothetical protein
MSRTTVARAGGVRYSQQVLSHVCADGRRYGKPPDLQQAELLDRATLDGAAPDNLVRTAAPKKPHDAGRPDRL